MHTHDLFVNKGYQRHVVETIPEGLPKGNFVSSLNFVEKSIDSGDSLGLMVTSQNHDLGWISDLKGKKEADNLATLLSTVDVISHEQVAGRFRNDLVALLLLIFVTHFFQHVEEVGILPMDISKNLDRSFELD